MKNRAYKSLLLLCIGVLIGSCTSSDELTDEVISQGQNIQISLSLPASQQPGSSSQTDKNLVNDPENKIERVNLYFFEAKADSVLLWDTPEAEISLVKEEPGRSKYSIHVPKDVQQELQGKDVKVVALVNGPSSLDINLDKNDALTNLKKYTIQTESMNEGDSSAFFMSGAVNSSQPIDFTSSSPCNLGEIKVKRAAAKIRILLGDVEVEGYNLVEGSAYARLLRYTNETSLSYQNPVTAGNYTNYYSTEPRRIDEYVMSSTGKKTYTTKEPFYSYENEWISDDSKETYLILELDLEKDGIEQTYYYHVPISYVLGDESSMLQRNHIYEISVDVNKLGNESPDDPVGLSGLLKIKEWTVEDINANLNKIKFLFAKEQNVIMPNIKSYQIEYLSSSKADLKSVTAIFYEYDNYSTNRVDMKPMQRFSPEHQTWYDIPVLTKKKGKWKHEYSENFDESCKVYLSTSVEGKTYINIENQIPIYYVPIEFTVTLALVESPEIKETIKIKQYPPIYLEAEHSYPKYVYEDKGGDGNKQRNNFNLFTVNILTPLKEMKIGDPTRGQEYSCPDEMSNTLVSPQFIIASQRGVTYPLTYRAAQTRCHEYYEHKYGPYSTIFYELSLSYDPRFHFDVTDIHLREIFHSDKDIPYKGRWRMPSQKELELVQKIQSDPNSAVKKLFDTDDTSYTRTHSSSTKYAFYWSASDKESMTFSSGDNSIGKWHEFTKLKTAQYAHMRCVFDIYKYNNK